MWGKIPRPTHSENQLITAADGMVSASYLYDPKGRQAQKTVNGTKTRYIHAGIRIIAEYDNAGDFSKRYVHGTSLDEVLLEIDDSNDVTYLHHDRIGSIIATTNDTGSVIDTYAYSPWGECGDMSGTTFGFQGQRFDHETGLYFMKARHYDPKIGRFLQPDPIGYGDGLNMYQFGYNNPNSFSDPLGLGGADGSQGSSDTGSGANSSGNSGSVDYDHVLMGDPNFGDHTHIDGTIPDTKPPDEGSPSTAKTQVFLVFKTMENYWAPFLYHTGIVIVQDGNAVWATGAGPVGPYAGNIFAVGLGLAKLGAWTVDNGADAQAILDQSAKTMLLNVSATAVKSAFAQVSAYVNSHNINYWPLARNSNTVISATLRRAGLNLSLSAVPGWGFDPLGNPIHPGTGVPPFGLPNGTPVIPPSGVPVPPKNYT